jgi:hypothetical protein
MNWRKFKDRGEILAVACAFAWSFAAGGMGGEGDPGGLRDRHGLLVPGQFLHIPGPNPILVPGAAGAWDDGVIEAADAFHDDQTFYLYYHGTGQGKAVFLIRSIAPGDRAVIFWYIRENA